MKQNICAIICIIIFLKMLSFRSNLKKVMLKLWALTWKTEFVCYVQFEPTIPQPCAPRRTWSVDPSWIPTCSRCTFWLRPRQRCRLPANNSLWIFFWISCIYRRLGRTRNAGQVNEIKQEPLMNTDVYICYLFIKIQMAISSNRRNKLKMVLLQNLKTAQLDFPKITRIRPRYFTVRIECRSKKLTRFGKSVYDFTIKNSCLGLVIWF